MMTVYHILKENNYVQKLYHQDYVQLEFPAIRGKWNKILHFRNTYCGQMKRFLHEKSAATIRHKIYLNFHVNSIQIHWSISL